LFLAAEPTHLLFSFSAGLFLLLKEKGWGQGTGSRT
jgi:hypothetical protein